MWSQIAHTYTRPPCQIFMYGGDVLMLQGPLAFERVSGAELMTDREIKAARYIIIATFYWATSNLFDRKSQGTHRDYFYHSPDTREDQLHLQQPSTATAFLTSVDPTFSSIL